MVLVQNKNIIITKNIIIMERFVVDRVEKETPLIDFDFQRGVLLIEGYSMPSDPVAFYDPVIEKIEEYLKSSPESFIFEMKLVYFNTASSKKLLDFINLFPETAVVRWFYSEDDEDMMEAGQDFSTVLDTKIKFHFIPIVEESTS